MNYFGNFDAKASDVLSQHALGHVESTTVHATHVPSDAIVVSDAHLLFGAEFRRAGVDLVLSGDGREVVLHDYFKGEHRAPLASPDGAHLTGDLVTALAGQVQYAQADGNAAAGQVIGHVTKLAGTATAVRNGVSIILNNGDNVEKGDVVASGSDSTVGITFIDGTVFGLSSNARMVLNEMVYDPNGSNNSSLLSLVAGTITFVAGETAKHGDMKIDTPVATMGIRGTAVLVEIDFSVPGAAPDAKFQVLVEPDGTTGSYILFDKTTLTPLAVVDHAGLQINISNGIMSQTLAPLSPEIQKLITDVFSLKFTDSTNTKSLDHFTDTIAPTTFGATKFALGPTSVPTIPVIVNLVVAGSDTPDSNGPNIGHIAGKPTVLVTNAAITELPGKTGSTTPDKVTGQITYGDVNKGDSPTASVKFASFSYMDANGQTHTDATGLNQQQFDDITKVEAVITVVQDAALKNNGTATWSYSVPDGSFDFLAAGETLTLTYNARVDNNFAPSDESTTVPITITITGTNDVPVITTSQQNIAFAAAGTGTKGGDLLPDTTTSGTLAFKDADLTDTHTVAVKMTGALLDGQSFAATVGPAVIAELAAAVTVGIATGDDSTLKGTGTIDWSLANLQVFLADLIPNGESLVLTYVVTVTDSQGATATQDIVVTIGGDNAAALVWVDTSPIPPGGALWSTALNWEGDRTPTISDDVIIGTDQLLPGTPTFPVTVNVDAFAKSLTMDYFTDFGTSIPELDVETGVTLTIAGALSLDTNADSGSPLTAESIIKNYGTISVGGIAELLKHSVLNNYGTITLAEGGVFGDQSSITNSGTIEVVSGTLTSEVGIANFVTTTVNEALVTVAGTIQVDGGATLELADGAVITNGQVTLGSLSVLDVERGAASLPAGTPDATLDGVTVIGTGGPTPSTIEIGASGAAILLLDDGTSIKNGNLTIGSGSALDITTSGATLDGVNVTGTNGSSGGAGAMLGGLDAHSGVLVTASTIEVGTTTTTGTVLTLDDGTTITNGNLIIDSGNTLDIESSKGAMLDGVNVTNSGTIQVDGVISPPSTPTTVTLVLDGGTTITGGDLLIHSPDSPDEGIVEIETGGATFDDVTVTNNNELKIDSSVTLTLDNGTTVNGGTIVDNGTVLVAGSSEIENATVNGGGDLTVTGGTLTLSGVTLDDVTLAGSFANADTLTIDETVTLNDATISGGTIDDTGALSVTASSEIENATVDGSGDLTVTGGTLTLSEVTLDNVTLAGSFANADTLTIDGTVTLNGATISGGTIDDTGTLASPTLPSTIENATVDGGGNLTGEMTFSGVTLDDVTLTGLFVNSDTLTIDGTVTIKGGGPLFGGTIDDTGTLSIVAGFIGGATIDGGGDVTSTGTLATLETVTLDDVTLSGSFIVLDNLKIDDTVTLDGVTFSGSPIDDTGTLLITASSEIESAMVDGGGDLTVTGGTLTLSDVTLENLTLSGSFTNASVLNIEGTDTLNGATISGGTIDDLGALLVTASSEIENATVNGGEIGDITVTGGTLTLSGVTLDGPTLSGSFKNLDTLTIDGTVTLNDATISDGTIADTGTLSVTASSEIENATVDGGGDLTVTGGQTLTLSGVTLDDVTLSGSVTNADTLTIGETVKLNDATISGGTIKDTGTLSVTASSEIENATVDGGGDLTVTGGTLTLATVTLDDVTLAGSFANSGTLTIKDTVTLNGVTLNGGTIDDTGTLSINGSSLLENVTIDGGGDLTATSGEPRLAGVTLDDVMLAGSFSDFNATLTIDGAVTLNGATISGGTFGGLIDNDGTLLVTASSEIDHVNIDDGGHITVTGGTLTFGASTTLDGGTLTGSFGISQELSVDGTVTLNDATISGGTIKDTGTLSVTTSSEIENATVDGGGDLTVTSGQTLTLSGVTLDDVTLAGSFTNSDTQTVKDTVKLDGATISGGTIDDTATGTLSVTASSEIENATVNGGGDITVASGQILTLSGVTLDDVTLAGSFANADTLTIKDTVKLNGATISGGTIDDTATGTLSVTASSEIENATVNGGGDITVTSGKTLTLSGVTLDDVTLAGGFTNADRLTIKDTVKLNGATISGGTIDDTATGTLSVIASSEIENATVNGGGDITVASGHILTLSGVTLDALTLAGSFSNSGTLTIDDTVTFNGVTISGGTLDISGILDSTGTTTISGATIVNSDHIDVVSGTLTIDPTPFTNNGVFDVQSSAVFSGEVHTFPHNVVQIDQEVVTNTNGTIKIDAGGTLTLFDATINGGTIIDNGTLLVTGTTSKLENVTFSGAATLHITSGATLELGGSGYSGVTVKFDQADGGGLLVLDDSHHFNGTISGLVEADPESAENRVDLTDLTYTANKMSLSFNSTTDMLTITNNSSHAHPDSVSLHIATGSNFSAEFEVHSDTTIGGSGGTLLDDPSATGVNTIDSGDVLGILAASSATINFTNTAGTTGELLLADSKDFTGAISGFTGDGTVANSDLIDVTDVNIADVATNKTTYADHGNGTGTLTLYNANGQALDSINLDGNYQLANFTIEGDGNGGTLIVDPPVKASGQAPGSTTVASGHNSAGGAAADGFVFNFAGHNHAPTADFHPDLDTFQPGGPMLTNLHTGSNPAPDLGNSNLSPGSDGHDHLGLAGFVKAHLNSSDFHFV